MQSQSMFSSGSDPDSESSSRKDPGFTGGRSIATSALGDEVAEGSGAGPISSPVIYASIVSSMSGLGDASSLAGGESALGPYTPSGSSALGQSGLPAAGFMMLEPPMSIPHAEGRRSRARKSSRVRGAVGGNDAAVGSSAGGATAGSSTAEKAGGGSQFEIELGAPPVGRTDREGRLNPEQGGEDDDDTDEGDDAGVKASSSTSTSPSRERRRRRPSGSSGGIGGGGGANDSADFEGVGGKRRQVPTLKHRRSRGGGSRGSSNASSWGVLPEGAVAAFGGLDEREAIDEEGDLPYLSGQGSEFYSGSAFGASDYTPSEVAQSEVFDSNTTWAGASALSVATARTGGWGSVLDTGSALSFVGGSGQLSTASKLDAAAWSQPSGRNGDASGNNGNVVTVVTARDNNGAKGRASPVRTGVSLAGTPARRGSSRKSKSESKRNNTMSSVVAKPRSLSRPSATTSRRAVMSPHGVAMDAALRIVEEHGARLGIVREEADAYAHDKAAAAAAAARDPSYGSQVASPAMTSQEQRRQRAKAWAKSRWGSDMSKISTMGGASLFQFIPLMSEIPRRYIRMKWCRY